MRVMVGLMFIPRKPTTMRLMPFLMVLGLALFGSVRVRWMVQPFRPSLSLMTYCGMPVRLAQPDRLSVFPR